MKKFIALACLSLVTVYASAEGYQVNSQSTKQSGMGHVGAAMKLGSESMHFNPAGLGFMDKKVDLSVGMSGVFSSAKYSEGNYSHEADNDPSTPFYVYAGFKVFDNLSAGISVTTPYGSTMNWGETWNGSYLVQKIALKSFSFQPTLSYRIFDRLSVGAGLMVMMGDFSLSRALVTDKDLQVLALAKPELKPIADQFKGSTPMSAALSGDADVKLGFNVGAMFDVTDQITVGVSYRSKVKMQVQEGRAVLSYANESVLKPILSTFTPPLDKGTFVSELPLPSNLNVAVTYKPCDRLLVSGEVQFVGWGAYDELAVQFSQEVLEGYSIVAPKSYKNTRIYRLGGQLAATKRLDVRLGAYFDESPVRTDYLNPETPSMNKLGLTTGCSFRPAQNFSVDFAFSYVTGFGRDGSYTDIDPLTKKARVFKGHYSVHAFTPSLGLAYSF